MEITPSRSPFVPVDHEGFKLAKIEHYLQRAEDFLHMARFPMSLKTLESIFALDPRNASARSLQKRVEYSISTVKGNDKGTELGLAEKRRRGDIVLVVDQDERVLTLLVGALTRYGFRGLGAGNYGEAIEAVTSYRPAMVVSEVNFENGPVGYDLYLWVRTTTETREIPFLFLATRIDRDALIAGKRLGVNDFILKPLDEELVVASVINCLARSRKAVS